ncbi:hypothetical protein [Cupriavidus sp. H18C1]|uniref:hypothetical protein n=1 Tax=Cupriavidus sp. H18C1 TaxID=3241601 RepID=UPI003BB95005
MAAKRAASGSGQGIRRQHRAIAAHQRRAVTVGVFEELPVEVREIGRPQRDRHNAGEPLAVHARHAGLEHRLGDHAADQHRRQVHGLAIDHDRAIVLPFRDIEHRRRIEQAADQQRAVVAEDAQRKGLRQPPAHPGHAPMQFELMVADVRVAPLHGQVAQALVGQPVALHYLAGVLLHHPCEQRALALRVGERIAQREPAPAGQQAQRQQQGAGQQQRGNAPAQRKIGLGGRPAWPRRSRTYSWRDPGAAWHRRSAGCEPA